VTAVVARDGFYRQLTVSANPSLTDLLAGTATGVSVAAIGAQAQGNGQAGSAQVDVAGFKFKNPSDLSDGADNKALLFYFGYLGISGTWDSTTATASLSGAAAEIAASWETVFAYYDNDGAPGFQWTLGKDFLDCPKATIEKFDCVDPAGSIDLKNITWNGIAVTNTSCPAGYDNPACRVYALNTSSADGSVIFTLRLASEPVLINNVLVKPNYGKIDVTINYPWASKTLQNAAAAKVGIVAYTAGRAASGSADVQAVDGKAAVQYVVEDKSAYFSWDAQAEITGSNGGKVYADYHSGASVAALNCGNIILPTCGLASYAVFSLQIRQAWMAAFKWNTEMLIFSWNELRPVQVMWDPAIGLTEGNAGVFIAPATTLLAITTIVANLF
jgi:hypothetical protein